MNKYLLLLGLSVCLYACKRDDKVYAPGNKNAAKVSDIIKFSSISNLNPEADTVGISLINVRINPEADSSNRTVTFSTNLGVFINGQTSITVTANAYGDAQTGIRSTIAGDAMISASIKSAKIDTLIHFVSALPDDLLISADNYSVDSSQAVNITVSLFRSRIRGLPTDGAKIFFSVSPNMGIRALVYPAFIISSDHKGIIEIKNPFRISGEFKVEAKTLGAAGDTIKRSLNMEIR